MDSLWTLYGALQSSYEFANGTVGAAVHLYEMRTFLHEGVFVIQGTLVRVVEVADGGDEVVVEYTDKEGFPHYIKGIRPEELK